MRKDEVAAFLFERALGDETLEAMRKRLLDMADQQLDRPAPDTRLGLALIAMTTPGIKKPSAKEVKRVMPRVISLLTQEERERAGY